MIGRSRRGSRRAGDARARERGAVAVELALVVPLLVVLVFGIIGFGFVFSQQLALSNAAREGARFGSVNFYDDTDPSGSAHTCGSVVATTQDAISGLGIDGAEVKVKVSRGDSLLCSSTGSTALPCEGAAPDTELEVRTEFTSKFLIPLFLEEPQLDLAATGVFRCEYS
jgi:hypothetical protein